LRTFRLENRHGERTNNQDKQGQGARKYVFFEEKIAVIELELSLAVFFIRYNRIRTGYDTGIVY
jgi:hypothetical protein